jgi:O-antigen ligase
VLASNAPALAALALFAVKALGLAWSDAPFGHAWTYFRKYDDLLLPAVLVTLMLDDLDRRRALLALAAGVALTLLLSYGIALGVVADWKFITATPDNPTVFRKYIAHSIVVAFGALLFALLALGEQRRGWRALWWGLALLAAVNVLFLVVGRTGYLVLVVAVQVLLAGLWGWRGLAASVLALSLVFAGGYRLSSNLSQRVDQVAAELQRWQPGTPMHGGVIERLEFYRNTLRMIREQPWLGVGTGDFDLEYEKQVAGTGLMVTRHPHNQYLMTAAQTGVLGLAVLLAMFAVQLRAARRLALRDLRLLAYGIVLSSALAGLFNSILMDHMESLLYAWCVGVVFSALPRPAAPRQAGASTA